MMGGFGGFSQAAELSARLPPEAPKEWEGRRFPAAESTQKSGKVQRKKLVEFFRRCGDEMTSIKTQKLLKAAHKDGAEVGQIMIRWQHELLEAVGIDIKLGVQTLSNMQILYANDQEISTLSRHFMQTCQMAAMRVKVPEITADVDPEKRRYKPAETLQKDGKIDRTTLITFFERCIEMLNSWESRKLLQESAREKQDPGHLSITWQREIFEAVGIEQDMGVMSLNRLQYDFVNDDELFLMMKNFMNACQSSVGGAVQHLDTKFNAGEPSSRRLPPADELQREPPVDREVLMEFMEKATEMMNSDETTDLLEGKDRKDIDGLIVSWQRQILESLGIEQELGCFALQHGAMVKYTDDEEYMRSMRQFYVSCSMVSKKVGMTPNNTEPQVQSEQGSHNKKN